MIYTARKRPSTAQRGATTGAPLTLEAHAPALVRAASSDTGTAQDNVLRGVPCRMGYAYPIGWGDYEVIFPGAFASALPRFMREGTVLRDHKWDKLPIAYPTLLEQRGQELYGEATYHDHPEAQAARGVAIQRTANGLMVGLSIGFFLESDCYMWFLSGEALLEFAQANGYDMSLFDAKQIKACDGWICGVTEIRQLAEYSQISVLQANDAACLEEARGINTNELPEPSAPAQDAEATAKAAAKAALVEATQLRDKRFRGLRAAALEVLSPKG